MTFHAQQQELFAGPTRCPACRATSDEPHATRCSYDRERQADSGPFRLKRPKQCLNAYDPSTAPLPEGY